MSLDWDLRKIKNLQQKRETNPFLDGMIWASMYIGMPSMTERNVVDFYARMKLYDQAVGEIWSRSKDDNGVLQHNFPTFEQVRDWIGLKTNAERYTSQQFFSQIKNILSRRYEEIVKDTERSVMT